MKLKTTDELLGRASTLSAQYTPEETTWVEPSRNNRPKSMAAPLAFSILTGLVEAKMFFFSGDSYDEQNGAFGLLFLTSVILAAWLLAVYPTRPPKINFRTEQYDRADECRVVLKIYVDGRQIGVDEGVMGVDKDLLFFVGRASSFALGTQDLERLRRWSNKDGIPVSSHTDLFILQLRHPRHRVKLVVSVVEVRRVLSPVLRMFLERAKPTARARSYPPLEKPDVRKATQLPSSFSRKGP